VYPPTVVRLRLGKYVPEVTNIHTIEELLGASFSLRSVSYQRKVVNAFFPELLVFSSPSGSGLLICSESELGLLLKE
jgi:hypothetical protein